MEGHTSNHSFDPQIFKGAAYRSTSEDDHHCEEECSYQSVTFDSGICLSNYKSTDKNFLSNEVASYQESIEERLRNLHLREPATGAVQMTIQTPVQPVVENSVTTNCFVNSVPVPVNSVPSDPTTTADTYFEDQFFKQDDEGDTCLHLAIIKPDFQAVVRLIEMTKISEYLDIQNKMYLHTPLHLAVITNQPQIVRALVISGASVTTRDRNGNTALHLACKHGHLECVKQLTAMPNEQEQQYVWCLCETRHLPLRMIKPMLTADINLMNYEGENCLHLALNSHADTRIEIISYLVNCCEANINVEDGKCGYTILHQAIKARDMAMVHFLLQFPQLAINQVCYNGCTALDIARSLELHQVESMLQMAGAIASESTSDFINFHDDNQVHEFDDLTIGGFRLNC